MISWEYSISGIKQAAIHLLTKMQWGVFQLNKGEKSHWSAIFLSTMKEMRNSGVIVLYLLVIYGLLSPQGRKTLKGRKSGLFIPGLYFECKMQFTCEQNILT